MRFKIKKLMYYFCIFLCIGTLLISTYLQASYSKFNSNNVIDQIKYLSSNEFEGRRTGTNGNEKAASLIESSFKKYNLSSIGSSYRQTFKTTIPVRNNLNPEFSIKKSSGIYKNYIYGIDFKEDMTNFRTFKVTFNKNDVINISSKSFLINHENKLFLFYVSFDKNFNFRSSFNKNSPYEFSIAITPYLFNDILNELRDGSDINVTLPYKLSECTTSNIIGVIHGTCPTMPPLVLCAHFDHLGYDCLGNYYSGAFDNASGTCFLLELSKSLSSLLKPKRDIIFVAFTGEEYGLIGSSTFVSEYESKIKNSKIINFDMVGLQNTPITLMGGSNFINNNINTSQLSIDLENICKKKNLNYCIKFQDCSDHASFTNVDIDSVTVCNSDLSKIHIPQDKVDSLSSAPISDIYSVVIDEIYNQAYDSKLLFLYNPYTIIISLILTLLFIFIPYLSKNK